ncbi:bifunctional diguanylate cyclase/phosphodiesterase [Muricoccus pecuniae]|uniref:Diguanylate cyclase (GGDEF)-like protein/PAS domain S-box-containing protein n=1 Tax=Muricoccus pecuniae TaxID=693023 RepID=A0A840YL35_9PROT|nr:EAL domain-containing protein [Roseomonas pecuniae]MBB5695293.1 diguanylate cyclase (GGDEF)-like protein/PAS domain S-box-containing protein [Roseomonas pecuniae]
MLSPALAGRSWLARLRRFWLGDASADEREDRRTGRWRTVAALLVGLAIAIGTAGYLASGREAALRDAEREVRNISLVLADWVEDGFRSVEQLEGGIAEWVRAEEGITPENFRERFATLGAHEMLRARLAAAPRVERLFLADRDGALVVNSALFPAPGISVLGRDYFEALRSPEGGDTYLSSPVRNQVDGRWSVFVAHRLRNAEGEFLGIAGAAIDLRRFERFFSGLALGASSSIALTRRDAVLLARHPWLEDRVGKSLAKSETFTKVLPVTSFGSFRSVSTLDGVQRILGVKALDAYPLVVVATRSSDEVLADWRREARHLGGAAVLLEVLILAGLLLTNRQVRARAALRRMAAAKAAAEADLSIAREREAAAQAIAEREGALQAVFETGTVGVAEIDASISRFVRVNPRFCEMTGRAEAELLGGLGVADVVHPDDLEADLARWYAIRDAGGARDAEKRYLRPDGSVLWVRLSMTVSARDAEGRPTRCVAVVQDITESRSAAERLRASEALLRVGQKVGRIGSFSRDIATGALQCGAETREMFGLPAGEEPIPAEIWMAGVFPEDRERLAATIAEAIEQGAQEVAAKYRIQRLTDGSLRRVEMRARYEFDEAGRPIGSVGVAIDVTEREEAEERLRANEALLRLSMEVGHFGSFTRDFSSQAFTCGPETRALLGLPAGDEPIALATWLETVLPEEREGLVARIAEAQAGCQPEIALQYRMLHSRTGELRYIDVRARYEYDAGGRPVRSVGAVIDVTEQRQAEARIMHLARHDALTGLPNRVLFRERLDEALLRARRGEAFAVLCLDLDRFKEVNDTLGHPAGDALLRAIAERLAAELRETDTLARLGGDEFAIIQSGIRQPGDATILARRLVEVVGAPLDLDGNHVVVGTSIGISVAPMDSLEADALLKGADMALYRAKGEGRGRWRFFEAEMDARMQLRRVLELDLRRALTAGEFELHYQPVVEVATRRVRGAEALIRWRHPERGLVSPDSFIPLAEEIGLIVPLGEWVLIRACKEAVTWPGVPKVAVNLSPTQFTSRGLVDAVVSALELSGLEPSRLELEITETVMLKDTEATLATLHRLKALGVRIAMDDFGTGYSSLSYLQRFPFDKVKIDRSFTSGLELSRQSNAIVRAVTDLCAGLDMTTTAEGVETEEQLRALRREGCQEAQGYLFSRPCPAGEIRGVLERLERDASVPAG